jgi:hypothetical protein
MNELITGHLNLTSNGVGQGHITSKANGARAVESSSNNKEILERTALSAVLSVSKGKLHAQSREVDTSTVVDDVSISHKSAAVHDKTDAETLATKKDEKSKQDQGSGGDSESFSGAQATETLKAKSQADEENLKQLVTALKSLKKSDCRRILESSSSDPAHAISNLWNNDSNQRLTEAVKVLDGFETRLKARIESFSDFEQFNTFVHGKHAQSDDQILAAVLYNVAEGFSQNTEKRISGFDSNVRNEKLRDLFEFFHSEDHRVSGAQKRLFKDLNLVYLKTVLAEDQKTEKLHYRLEAVFKFSRIKTINPLEKLRQKIVAKFADDKSIQTKAKSFKETTEKNWSSLLEKLARTVSEFSNILFSGLFSLLSEANDKIGKDLVAKPAPSFVRSNQKIK